MRVAVPGAVAYELLHTEAAIWKVQMPGRRACL